MNGLISSGGGKAYGVEVTSNLTEIIQASPSYKYIRITNLGSTEVFIGPANSGLAKDTGIALSPKGTAASFVEFNNTGMFYCDFHAVTASGTAKLAILLGY